MEIDYNAIASALANCYTFGTDRLTEEEQALVEGWADKVEHGPDGYYGYCRTCGRGGRGYKVTFPDGEVVTLGYPAACDCTAISEEE